MVNASPDQQIADVIGGASNSKSPGPVAAEELQAELAKIAHAPDGEAEASKSEAAATPKSQALDGEAEASQSEAAAIPKSQAPVGEAEASQSEAAATPKSQAPDGEAEGGQKESPTEEELAQMQKEASDKDALIKQARELLVEATDSYQERMNRESESESPTGEQKAPADGEAKGSQSQALAAPTSQ